MSSFIRIGKDATCLIVSFLSARELSLMFSMSRAFRALPKFIWDSKIELPGLTYGLDMHRIVRWNMMKRFMSKYVSRIFWYQNVAWEYPHSIEKYAYMVNASAHNKDLEALLADGIYGEEMIWALIGRHIPNLDVCYTSPIACYRFDPDFHPKALRLVLQKYPTQLYGRMFVALFEQPRREYKEVHALWEQMEEAFTKRTDWMESQSNAVTGYVPKEVKRKRTLGDNLHFGFDGWQDMEVWFREKLAHRVFRGCSEDMCQLFMDTFYVTHSNVLANALKHTSLDTPAVSEKRAAFMCHLFDVYYEDV